jgi:hypothetical protein
MPYVIPSLRKKVTEEDQMKIVQEQMEVHFPTLSNTIIQPKDNLAYAAKAKEWEAKREALELKERVDAKVAAIMAEREEQERLEARRIARTKAPEPAVYVIPEVEEIPEPVKDEWTVVQKKIRRPKKEKAFEEDEEFNYDHLAEDQPEE